MVNTFNLPVLGENIDAGTVISVLVKKGDAISKDQAILELETDKAVVEVPCSVDGTVEKVLVNEGDTIEIGAPLLELGSAGAAAPAKEEVKEKAPAPAKTEPEQPVKEEAPAPVAAPSPADSKANNAVPRPSKKVRSAPSVRKLAREIGVDIGQVNPSAAGKAITAADVKAHAKNILTSGGSAPMAGGIAAVPLPDFARFGDIRREAMSNVRKVTMESMTRSWTTIPHVTQQDKADITELEKFRKSFGGPVQQAGGKLTATAILVKVLAEALKKFPQFNVSLDAPNTEIIYKDYYNIGVAVDTEHGLMVPVIKDVDQKSITEIALDLTDISQKARSRKLSLDDFQGSCMTITNLGGIGGTSFTPIVNSPEVAILGVSRSTMEPVYIDGEFVPRNMMPLSLSYDHRAIDGADGARFTRWICTALEHPMSILLN
jgi:pyruvate dehydrogenase E2 component (dihydrolipoamide acetyltransferase)